MKKSKKNQVVKMNLTMPQEFHNLLKENAKKDYLKVATWTKKFLMESLLEGHNAGSKTINQNEREL